MPKLLRVSQIVEEYPVSRTHCWNLIKSGSFESIKVSSRVTVVTRESIDLYFYRNRKDKNGNL
jgi:predicted DNA-binding transcriptional regulator AlpA